MGCVYKPTAPRLKEQSGRGVERGKYLEDSEKCYEMLSSAMTRPLYSGIHKGSVHLHESCIRSSQPKSHHGLSCTPSEGTVGNRWPLGDRDLVFLEYGP